MQTALTFVAILSIVMLFLCGTRPAFILLAVLAAVSMVCCIVVSYILRKRTDEKDAKDAALQNKITNWRKVRRRQLRSDANSDGMFDTGGIIQDLRLSLEEDEQFCEEKHEINNILNARVRSINARVRFLCIFVYLSLIFCEEERQ